MLETITNFENRSSIACSHMLTAEVYSVWSGIVEMVIVPAKNNKNTSC